MINTQAQARSRFRSLKRICLNGLLLLCVGGCAARGTVVAHSEPRVVSESESRLVVESQHHDDGSVSLLVIRETDRVLEMEYWKENALRGAGMWSCAVASSDCGWWQFLDPRFVVTVVAGTYYVVLGMAEIIQYVVARAIHGIASIMPGPETGQISKAGLQSGDQFILRWKETIRQPIPSVTLVPACGSGALLLGPQPEDGYRLDPALVERLGGRGAQFVVSDGELSVTGTLGNTR
ncbi:MAG: hypothetical protein FD180_1552 [Planctomycetota bacterium]|nr:MAG: hypothetical protein FD180_1552 [Planctomycetota bacterium]